MEATQRLESGPAATPIVLRPMGLGEILDVAFTLYRKNFLLLIGIGAVINVPVVLVQILAAVVTMPVDFNVFSRNPTSFSNYSGLAIFYLVLMVTGVIAAIANIFEFGAMAVAISEKYLGRTVTLRQAYGRTLRHWFRLIVASILLGLIALIFIAPIFLFLGVTFFSSTIDRQSASALAAIGSLCMCLGMIVLLPVWIYLMIRFSFYIQAIVLENLGSRAGLARSWRLVKNSFLRVFGILMMLGILVYILTMVPSTLIQFAVMALAPTSLTLTTVASSVSTVLVSLLIEPIQIAVLTLLYYDLRIRKEGFDLQFQMQLTDSASTGNA